MTAEEKLKIFNLLKTADGYINGYERKNFINTPEFCDDRIEKVEIISPAATNEKSTEQKYSGNGKTIEQINEKILHCTRCPLAGTRTNCVPGEGVSNPLVMVIGEGPGYEEDVQGRPFVGKAGQLLDKMLAAIQLDRNNNCYIANIVKCRPPQNRDPYPQEQDACYAFLEAQINILKPKMLLCLGRISAHKLLNTEESISKIHGKLFEYNKIPLMITYHPSALLRNEELKRPAWDDLKLFRQKLNELTSN